GECPRPHRRLGHCSATIVRTPREELRHRATVGSRASRGRHPAREATRSLRRAQKRRKTALMVRSLAAVLLRPFQLSPPSPHLSQPSRPGSIRESAAVGEPPILRRPLRATDPLRLALRPFAV